MNYPCEICESGHCFTRATNMVNLRTLKNVRLCNWCIGRVNKRDEEYRHYHPKTSWKGAVKRLARDIKLQQQNIPTYGKNPL